MRSVSHEHHEYPLPGRLQKENHLNSEDPHVNPKESEVQTRRNRYQNQRGFIQNRPRRRESGGGRKKPSKRVWRLLVQARQIQVEILLSPFLLSVQNHPPNCIHLRSLTSPIFLSFFFPEFNLEDSALAVVFFQLSVLSLLSPFCIPIARKGMVSYLRVVDSEIRGKFSAC